MTPPLALVVENDVSTQKLLHVLLAREGYDVDLVASGRQGLLLLRHVAYDLIILDLMLPEVSGFEILARLAAADRARMQQVIIASSVPAGQMQSIRQLYPETTIIMKPFDIQDISEAAQRKYREPAGSRTLSEAFCRTSVVAGAKAGVVARVAPDGATLQLVTSFGYPPETLASYYPMRLDSPYPICAAVRNARPVWFSSLTGASTEYPLLTSVWRATDSRALAALPVIRDERVVGAAGWSFSEPQAFDDREQNAFATIAAVFADDLRSDDVVAAS